MKVLILSTQAFVCGDVVAAAIELAIGALPPPFKETLVLRDINGLSYHEIADIIGVPLGTVMSRLARARGLLMADLGRPEAK